MNVWLRRAHTVEWRLRPSNDLLQLMAGRLCDDPFFAHSVALTVRHRQVRRTVLRTLTIPRKLTQLHSKILELLLDRFPIDLTGGSSGDMSRWLLLLSRGNFFLTLLSAKSPRCEPYGVQYEWGINPSCLFSDITYTQSFSRYNTFTI